MLFSLTPQTLDILFTSANFLLFVGLCVYFFRRSKKSLVQEIEREQDQKRALLNYYEDLQKSFSETLANNQEQEASEIFFEKKVGLWRKSFDHELQKQRERSIVLQAKIQERRHKQEAGIQVAHFKTRALPHALAQARLELYKNFQESPEGALYIEKLLDQMGDHA